MDLSAVRAVEKTPKDAVERYFASHALMVLPALRLCDVDGSFLDDLIDCMEEIEVGAFFWDEGTVLVSDLRLAR